MILIVNNIVDNLIVMMRGIIFKIFFILCLLFSNTLNCFALEKVGIITDTLLTPINYYNAYYRTPIFFAQDIKG